MSNFQLKNARLILTFALVLILLNGDPVASLRDIRDLAPKNRSCDIRVMQAKYIKFEILPGAVCGATIAISLFLAITGYRFYKAGMFLTAFAPFAVGAFVISLNVSTLRMEYCAIIAFGTGIVVGLIVAFLAQLGLFVNGFLLGAIIAGATLIGVVELLPGYSYWIPVGSVSVVGLICAGVSLKWQKVFMVLASSAVAGASATVGTDYFVENFILVINAWDRIAFGSVQPLCWYSWATLGVLPFILIFGTIIQLACTGRNYEHNISGVRVKIGKKGSTYKFKNAPKKSSYYKSNGNHHANQQISANNRSNRAFSKYNANQAHARVTAVSIKKTTANDIYCEHVYEDVHKK